jgi:hypothetical protein
VNHVDDECMGSLPLNLIGRSDFILNATECYNLCSKYSLVASDRHFDCAACVHHFQRLGRY